MYVMLRYSHSYKRIQVEGANTRWAAAAAAFEQFQQEQGVQPDQSSADQDQDLVMITREVSSVDHDGSMNNTISTAEGPVPFKRQGSEKPLQSALRSRRSSERPTISLSLHQDVSSSALVVPIIPSSLPVVTNSHFLDCESDNYTSSSPSRTTDSSLYSSSSPSKLTNPLNLIKPSQSHHPAALPLESTPTPQTENLPQALPLSYTPTIDDATQPTRRSSLSSAQPEQTRRGQRKVSFSSNVTMIKDPRPLLLLQTVPSAISSTAMDEDPSASMSSLASSPSVASVENTDTTGARLLGALRETAQKVRRSSSHALSSLSGSSMSVASPHGSVLSLKKGKMDAATPVERMEMEGVVFVENVEKGGERIEVEEDGGVGGRKRQGKWRGWWIGVVRVFGRGKKRMTGKK
ncbi:hypothetical protein BC829DRAFT_405156 [Chytridium lagenaria]|nr:hypothetical protein BC829DRAFT_405156 [Chytridium lagenaria]